MRCETPVNSAALFVFVRQALVYVPHLPSSNYLPWLIGVVQMTTGQPESVQESVADSIVPNSHDDITQIRYACKLMQDPIRKTSCFLLPCPLRALAFAPASGASSVSQQRLLFVRRVRLRVTKYR